MTTDLDHIETAVIANLRVIREQGHEKSSTVVGGDSIKAYKCGAIIRIDIKEEK